MCKWGTDVNLLVPIPAEASHTGKFRWAIKPVDACIAPLVKALNEAGIYTAGSCCGHGQYTGTIVLHDGRVLEIHHTEEYEPCWDDAESKTEAG